MDKTNREWCNLKSFDLNIWYKIIALVLEKKTVQETVQMCLAESTSLKEIAGLWSVTVLDYLYVVTGGSKLHSSTPNISVSTLLKILLNR